MGPAARDAAALGHLSCLHWPSDPADVQRRLPPGLEVDTFDGAAWIGLAGCLTGCIDCSRPQEGEEMQGAVSGPAPSTSRGRRIAFTVVAVIFGLGAAFGLFGVALIVGWFDNEAGGIHRVHYLGFGVLFGVILTTALFAMARRPETRPSAFYQVVAAALAALVAALVAADPGYLLFGVIMAVAAAILLALHPARSGVLHPVPHPSTIMGLVAFAGAVPLVWFGLTAARLQRDGAPVDPHVNMDHWAIMASMAFALVLVGFLAAARTRGWRLTAWCAGLGAAVYGLASIVFHRFPGTNVPYPGSEGIGWGLVAIVGGLAFIAVAEWEARRAPAA
jgi:hypothetical protein